MSYRNEDSKPESKVGAILGGVLTVIAIAIGIVMALTMRSIAPSQYAVFEYKPFLFGWSSLEERAYPGPNRFYMWPSTAMWTLDTTPVPINIHADDFMSADKMFLDFDVSLTVQFVKPEKASQMVRRFNTENVGNVFYKLVLQGVNPLGDKGKMRPSGEFMSFLRDEVRHHHSSVFIAAQNEDGSISSSASEVETKTMKHINDYLAKQGADMIQVTNLALGKANPPDGVRNAIDETARQGQEKKTQDARRLAQEARKAAEVATAEADNAYIDKVKLSTEQYVELKRLLTIEKVCGQDKGNNCIVPIGGGTSAPILVAPQRFERTAMPAKQ